MQERLQRHTSFALSGVAHFALAVAALIALHHTFSHVPVVIRPGIATGSHYTLDYSPHLSAGSYAEPQTLVAQTSKHIETANNPAQAARSLLPSPVAPVAGSTGEQTIVDGQQGKGTASGSDSLGDGDMQIALASSFPRPQPDLHSLPRGFQGDVVVDVVITADGKISETKLIRGVSPQVDQTVIATVQLWVFTPATKDGNPVASQQELLFHYGPV